ncbi:MAG: four helix bundle protein [Patescibacteria group bacterium]
MEKICRFTDLITWRKGHGLVLKVYGVVAKFPQHERFALSDQIRRAVISVTSNIAEGFSRQGRKEKIQFYYLSMGSLTEVQNQLLVARDVGYITPEEFMDIAVDSVEVSKLLRGLIKNVDKVV